MSRLRKINNSEEFEDCIFSEGDNDHEVDDNDEVFLQVRVDHVFQMIIFVSAI